MKDSAKTAVEAQEYVKTFAFTVKDHVNRDKSSGGKFDTNLLIDTGTGATSYIINDKSKVVSFDDKFNPTNHLIELADGSRANIRVATTII